MTLDDFLQAMVADPLSAPATWLVLADWLEEQGDPRAELVRLMYHPDYCHDLSPEQRDERVRQLLASGVGPVAPTLINSIGMRLVLIPAGIFLMGSPDGEGRPNEHPRHEVEITRPFFLGDCQVTQGEYQRVTGKNPSHFSPSGFGRNSVKELDTKQFPVETVSWVEAAEFCEALANLQEETNAGRTYRLPTEGEWEHACRGGAASHTPFHLGNTLSSTQANFNGNYPHGAAAKGPYLERPCPVGSYPANPFGVFDMHGNVWEWCTDWFNENTYQTSTRRDPHGPETGERRVLRGGGWNTHSGGCRSASHYRSTPSVRTRFIGFRVCCSIPL
jgi:uncharacterized protein (TIGR02996 family)